MPKLGGSALSGDRWYGLLTVLKFGRPTITGVAASVPFQKTINLEEEWEFPEHQVRAAVSRTGVLERRTASLAVTSSDLGYRAARALLDEMGIPEQGIDALIFVSQGPDYIMPMTAALLQSRLGLGNSVAAFDLNIGCSGYLYGLMVAFSLVESGLQRVLLVSGETPQRRYSKRDRGVAFLFGDAGAATLVERRDEVTPSFFELGTDGGKAGAIIMPAGGARSPLTDEAQVERLREDGSFRSDAQVYMNGAEVFSTVLSQVPDQIQSCLRQARATIEELDYLFLHQASDITNTALVRKLKIDRRKVPSSLASFGNTSGVSIPLTMVTEKSEQLRARPNLVALSGFGVGMSWGSAVLTLPRLSIPDLLEI